MLIARLERPVAGVLVAVAALMLDSQVTQLIVRWNELSPFIGLDYRLIMEAGERWTVGAGYYHPTQLAGPYPIPGDAWMLYPPPTLPLVVAFTFLPAIVWWVIPLGLTAWAIARHRPRPLALGVIALCLANPTTVTVILYGNPGMWIVAALALGTVHGWPSVLVFMKPTLAPFALFGVWSRSWWVALAALAGVSVAFLPLWADYFTVLRNAEHANGISYSIAQVPEMLLPIAAWLGSSDAASRRSLAWSLPARHRPT